MSLKTTVFIFLLSFTGISILQAQEPKTPFEKGDQNTSATYEEAMAWWQSFAESSAKVSIKTYKDGSDIGQPMHTVILSHDGMFHPKQVQQKGKSVVFILNGIHPGESCGVDASMMLARDLINDKMLEPLLNHIVLVIVPMYNIGGSLNRSCCTRANQDGPSMQGFRGNARNLDLNRDFFKMDSKNAHTFAQIFNEWQPDLFMDTHTTNGADYPATITWIPTHKDKIYGEIGQYMTETMGPSLQDFMDRTDYVLGPYVQGMKWHNPPDSGLVSFLESPRYSTGYAALYNTLGITVEAHMLKPFKDRVYGTYHFLISVLKTMNRDRVLISRMREAAQKDLEKKEEFAINWELDTEHPGSIKFRGYNASYKNSPVTGMRQVYYDRANSYEKDIPYYDTYKPSVTVKKPIAYVIPQAWWEVADRLKTAGVNLERLSEDVELDVEMYYIEGFETAEAYEGHYFHSDTKVRKENQKLQFYKGDYVVYPEGVHANLIVHGLEPEAADSWFNWNFFEEILMRKEYFSAYVFDKTAEKLIADHPEWKEELEKAKAEDENLRNSHWMQLDFIYRKSEWYEKTHRRYPVARVVEKQKLPTK